MAGECSHVVCRCDCGCLLLFFSISLYGGRDFGAGRVSVHDERAMDGAID